MFSKLADYIDIPACLTKISIFPHKRTSLELNYNISMLNIISNPNNSSLLFVEETREIVNIINKWHKTQKTLSLSSKTLTF